MKTISDIGEFDLIARVSKRAQGNRAPQVVVGIGDDAAVVRPRAGEDVVVSTDTVVEGVHFRFENQSAAHVGRKAIAVNLSDLAAMGARPLACTLALAAPGTLPLKDYDAMVRGFIEEAERFDCPLVGGNLSRASEVSLAVTVLGAVKRGRALRRSGLKVGDRLFVTGVLGASTLSRLQSEASAKPLKHVPSARVAAGLALARVKGIGACIDISDGLLGDLGHLLDESGGLGASIDAASIPRPKGFSSDCERLGLDPDPVCLAGGEDYELLFSVRKSAPVSEAQLSRRLDTTVTEIGSVVARSGIHGVPHVADAAGGWRHF